MNSKIWIFFQIATAALSEFAKNLICTLNWHLFLYNGSLDFTKVTEKEISWMTERISEKQETIIKIQI